MLFFPFPNWLWFRLPFIFELEMNFANCSFCSGMTQGQRHQGHRKWFPRPTDAVSHPPAYGPSERQDIAVPGPWFGTIPRLSSFSLSRAACYARADERRIAFFLLFPVPTGFLSWCAWCFVLGPAQAYNNVGLEFWGAVPVLPFGSCCWQSKACLANSWHAPFIHCTEDRQPTGRRKGTRADGVAECNHFY